MSQSTLVLQIPAGERDSLRQRLEGPDFEFRAVPHALFSVKGAGVVATLYKSGKLVVQGADPQMFAARFVEEGTVAGGNSGGKKGGASSAGASEGPAEVAIARPLVGTDECGKGDYFGPLVVCGVRVGPEEAADLQRAGVADSKKIADTRIRVLGAALKQRLAWSIQRLDPPEYNRAYEKPGQLNKILAGLHAAAIRELAEDGDDVLIDQFAKRSLMERELKGLDIHLEQRPRAESNAAVAAASIIARLEFIEAMDRLSEESAVDLHKGAGDPVDVSALRYCEIHGFEALARVAKLHFKNTDKIRARLEHGS